MADKIFSEHPELFAEAVKETWFEIPYSNAPEITLCGTIDLIYYSPEDDTVVLLDYKTTSKPIDARLQTDYSLSSQRWFYINALLQDSIETLPIKFREAIRAGRVKWRYCFVNYDKQEYYLQPAEFVSSEELDEFRRLLHEKALLALALHEDPALSIREGIAYGLCWKCPYKLVCLQNNEEARNNVVTNWPYGREQRYYPKH